MSAPQRPTGWAVVDENGAHIDAAPVVYPSVRTAWSVARMCGPRHKVIGWPPAVGLGDGPAAHYGKEGVYHGD